MKTIINTFVALTTITGILFILGCGDDPMIALLGLGFLAPGLTYAKIYGEYLERKEGK